MDKKSHPAASRLRFRPALETLEDRLCMAGSCVAVAPLIAQARSSVEEAVATLRRMLAGSNQLANSAITARAVVDDAFENNDSLSQAANLGTVDATKSRNLVLADNADWFRIRLASRGVSGDAVELQFQHAQGDIDLEIYDAAGFRLARSQGVTNSERIALTGYSAGDYYIRVYGYQGSTNPSYTLTTRKQAPVTDDTFENNDTFSTASNLGVLTRARTVSNLVMADSADWFRFTMNGAGTSSDFVSLQFTHAQGDLDLALYNSAGQQVRISEGVVNGERISLSGLGSGTYFVSAYGYRGATNRSYSLTIDPGTQIVNPPPPPANSGFQIDLTYSGLTVSQQAIFRQAANRWSEVITGDLPDVVRNGIVIDDLRISASAVRIDGAGGVLGQAGPDGLRSGSSIPYSGSMEFDTADLASLERDGSLFSVILHEMGHVLGIGTTWDIRGLLQGSGTRNPLFTGARATAEYNAIFGVNASGVPVEQDGGPGTRDSHWDETLFGNELMSGFIAAAANPLSRVTVGSLADLGYTVNYAAADNYSPPA